MSQQDFSRRLPAVTLVVVSLIILWQAAEILLLFFAGLIAVVLRTLSQPLSQRTRLSDSWSVIAVVLLIAFGLLGLF